MKIANITIIALLFILTIALSGCVERRLTIKTNPPGALVELNDEQIGITPVTVPFSWYGDYKVRLSKDGYTTLNTHKKLKAPLHDRFPFDFFAQILWPNRIIDEYTWNFQLPQYQPPQRKDLIEKALVIRKRAKEQHEQATK